MINIHSGSATSKIVNYLLQHCPHIFSIFISVKRIYLLLLVEDASHQDEHLEMYFVHWVSFSVRPSASPLLLSHGSIIWLIRAADSLLEYGISKTRILGLVVDIGWGFCVVFLCVSLVCFVWLGFFPFDFKL